MAGAGLRTQAEKMGQSTFWEGEGMVRRVDSKIVAFVWCVKCSGYARCRQKRKTRKSTKKMEKIILDLEDGRVPDRNARGWRIEGVKREKSQGKIAKG